ncbi:MAG: cupin domain-containing protein [Candidatus Woesearchaeota archaeon]
MTRKITITNKIDEIANRPWYPLDVVRYNDQVVRIAFFKGEYKWHKHDYEDELFLVVEGKIKIKLKDSPDLVLMQGEIGVIPKGIEHCPTSEGAYVLMFEPATLDSKGDN